MESGYTLPVFACAAAIAALRWLLGDRDLTQVSLDLLEPAQTVSIPIEQVSGLGSGLSNRRALAITRSAPGDNLDLTRNTPLWAEVAIQDHPEPLPLDAPRLQLAGGEGIGKRLDPLRSSDPAQPQLNQPQLNQPQLNQAQPAIYQYAQTLLHHNLTPLLDRLLTPHQTCTVTLILPEGRALAERTSNAAFGVVEGLSLLGTSGISQPLSRPEQLEAFRADLVAKAQAFKNQPPNSLIFCIGENGLDLAPRLGLPADRLLKTANWLGPLLVEAGLQGIDHILLFGYHGKLLKLAAGIFHTHNHVADARLEILTAHAALQGLSPDRLQTLFHSPTADAALQQLRAWEQADQQAQQPVQQQANQQANQPPDGPAAWVTPIYGTIAAAIDDRAQAYIHKYCDHPVRIGSILFDRARQVILESPNGAAIAQSLRALPPNP